MWKNIIDYLSRDLKKKIIILYQLIWILNNPNKNNMYEMLRKVIFGKKRIDNTYKKKSFRLLTNKS